MADLLDDDLLLVQRGGASYKMLGADLKASLGPQPINPGPGDITPTPPFEGGTGTQGDPYIITPETNPTVGGQVLSSQQLVVVAGNPSDQVVWTDNSVGTGSRFAQPIGVVDGAGQWTGRLVYNDVPDSTVDNTVYTGDLQLGTAYFRWVVTQRVVPPLTEVTATTISGTESVGQTLTAVPGTATGGTPTISYATRWQRSNTGTGNWSDIAGATNVTYTLVTADGNQYVRAVTTATDATPVTPQTLEMPSASSGQITPTPPLTQNTPTTISGIAEIGSTLTAVAGTATGGTAPITYSTLKWQTSADGTSNWTDLPGATGTSYVIQGTDLNQYLRAVTTATDSTTPIAQTLDLPSASSAKVTAPVAVTLGWNAETDAYVRDPAANRIIDVHVRIRRCLLTNAGVATYLDADDSTKLAGDWLRLVETTELGTPYTGTHGAEVANTALRAAAPAWSAGTYTRGQRVTHNGSVWECLAATTTAAPAAGTAPATLNGTAGQVMVEIPRFSVKHETAAAGAYQQHTFHLTRGTKTDSGYAVHPAFVKPDLSFRDFIYVGAYQGTGTSGNGSASGVNNAVNFTRAACRTACSGRGAGWHQLGYWENNALQWLLITEYQDMNSQRVLGNGAMSSSVYVVPTGLSDGRGNRCGHAHTPAGANTDYVSYRGVENFYGRAWQWADGINVNERNVYLCADPSKWADDTSTGYTANGTVPTSGGDYQRDVMTGIALLPSSVTGASDTTFVGDALWTGSGWRVAHVGGSAGYGAQVGALCVGLGGASSFAATNLGGRLCYAA